MLLGVVLLLALTRAEIVERMRAPVVRQSDGLVQVFADCSEDMRREYQAPVGRFAADTVEVMYRAVKERPRRFARAGIVLHVGSGRTNDTTVVTKVVTNENAMVTKIYLKSPGYTDLERLRQEVIVAFFRAVKGEEVSRAEGVLAYRRAIPELRVADERQRLEDWMKGRGDLEDEAAIGYLRKVIEPGRASKREVLIFASRLFFYPPQYDVKFVGGYDGLSFKDAVKFLKVDPRIRLLALEKMKELAVYGGGRSEEMRKASEGYVKFLDMVMKGEAEEGELMQVLEVAENDLALAWERAG